MLQFDNITGFLGDQICHSGQFTRFVRQKNRYCEDSVTKNKTLLYHAGHSDHIHITAAQDGYNFLILHIQMFQCRNGKQSGILHDHFMVFHHIQECYYQFFILNGNDIIQIFLYKRENIGSRCLHCGSVCNGIDRRQCDNFAGFHRLLHAVCKSRFHTDHFDLRIQ